MTSSIGERRLRSRSLLPLSLLLSTFLRGHCADISVSPGGFQVRFETVTPLRLAFSSYISTLQRWKGEGGSAVI